MSETNDTTSAPEPANTPAPADTSPASPSEPSAPSSPPPTPSVNDAPAEPAPASEPAEPVDPAQHDRDGILAAIKAKTDSETTPTAHEPGQEPAKPEDAPKPEPEPDTGDAEDGDEGDDDEDPDANKLTDEERAAVSGKVQRKVGRLLRNVRRLEPDAKAYRNITQFMAEKQLTGSEAAMGFEVMAMLKGDDPRALDILQPYIERLQRVQGKLLPDDLKQKVDQGYVDADTAAEMARLRMANERAILERDNQAQVAQQTQATVRANSIASALNDWETRQSATPTYGALRKAVFDYAQASFAANPPATPADAVKRIEDFYQSLATMRPAAPAGVSRPVQAIRPGPSSTHSPSNVPAREPASLEDAIVLSLRKRGVA